MVRSLAGSSEMKGLQSNVSQRVVLEAPVAQLDAAHKEKGDLRPYPVITLDSE